MNKTYTITTEDIERLRNQLYATEQNILDKWVETLNYLDKTKAYTIIAPKINPNDYR